jgi:hypothetical protein
VGKILDFALNAGTYNDKDKCRYKCKNQNLCEKYFVMLYLPDRAKEAIFSFSHSGAKAQSF